LRRPLSPRKEIRDSAVEQTNLGAVTSALCRVAIGTPAIEHRCDGM
jgi:hypothetical protein